jgi:hypothetical protein
MNDRMYADPARSQFFMQLADPRLQLTAFDANPQIANAQRQYLLILKPDPGWLRRCFHSLIVTCDTFPRSYEIGG